ncbi:MAG: DUF4157 domain-containing protein [Pseudanabaena sp.]
MSRTFDNEKKPSLSTASVQPKATYLQTRGFAPLQTDLDEDAPVRPSGYSENFLEKLINQHSTESSDTPVQAKPINRLKLAQAQRMTIQAKLNIGEPNDKYEQEADATASRVVQQINSPTQAQSVQREAMEEEDELQMKPFSSIHRESTMEEEDELQMKSLVQRRENIGGGEASTDLESSIQRERGGGQSLDAGLQTKMGQAMGADFSGVKVHTDSQSDQLNKFIQAKAFTTGQDVFFRQGAYDPSSQGGQELIAHELTHVVQQNGGAVQRSPKLGGREFSVQLNTNTESIQGFFTTESVPDVRMSDGDQFIVVGKKNQSLFAQEGAINTANEALHNAGAIVRLNPGNGSFVAPQGKFVDVQLVADGENIAHTVWERMKGVADESEWRTFADCYRTSTTVSGMKKGLDQGGQLKLKTGNIDLISQDLLIAMGAPLNVASQARMTLFNHTFLSFKNKLAESDAEKFRILIQQIQDYLLDGKPNYVNANRIYLAITKHSEALALYNQLYGVNTEVVPEVGTALSQINDEKLTNYLNEKGEDKWNFHWAGVVMTDGTDYVTLENCAVEMHEVTMEEYMAEKEWFDDQSMYKLTSDKKMDIINQRWYFTLYGKGKDSFHGENLDDSHSTISALTLALTHT